MSAPKHMSDEWYDQVYAAKALISGKVTQLVDELTSGLTPEQDELTRTMLTEDYRFWETNRDQG